MNTQELIAKLREMGDKYGNVDVVIDASGSGVFEIVKAEMDRFDPSEPECIVLVAENEV